MRLGTTYLCVNDMQKSLVFYRTLLRMEPAYVNEGRWATFECGNSLSLYSRAYDARLIEERTTGRFNRAYIEAFEKEEGERRNNIVILNFTVDDLRGEHERLSGSGIGEVSEIMYVNVFAPYWYFNITDPDGNVLEITGKYK